jgi:rhodanese-related sulfurtransferase
MVDASALLRLRWDANLSRGAHDAPLTAPLFVAEQGPGVRIADLRSREEATGALGYIPGSAFLGVERLEQLARDAAAAPPLVLVCATGEDAADVARRLEALGLDNVAAMAGGIAAWRALGLSTSRDPAGVRDAFPSVPDARAVTGPLTLDRVREHVGDPRSVRWIKLASMLAHGRASCIDGRDERGVVGSPGGDGGEFLLTLAAIEQATGRELDEETIAQGLLARFDTFGHFYLHTDAHAFEALTGALRADPRVQPAVGITSHEEWFGFLRHAAPGAREALLEHLVEPAHIGCGHIRLMLQHSAEYGTRRELVLSFLRAFFRLWWEGAPETELVVLPGDHREAAVLNVRLAEEVWGLSRVPLISPACGGRQMFVNHPDVASFLRRATVQALVRGGGPLSVGTVQETNAPAIRRNHRSTFMPPAYRDSPPSGPPQHFVA